MSTAMLEHVNVTVSDPRRTAQHLCDLFDWRIRWEGAAQDGGFTVHVGNDESYVAVYAYPKRAPELKPEVRLRGALNHIGVLVDDLDAAERRVRTHGFKPHHFADYEPGRRFYFNDDDGIEFEVVSYS